MEDYEDDLPEDELLYYEGWAAFRNGDLETAYKLLLESVRLYEHAKTYERLYTVLVEMKKPVEAFPHIEKAYTLNPKNKETATLYASALVLQGRIDEAKAILVATLNHSRNFGPAQKLLNKLNE